MLCDEKPNSFAIKAQNAIDALWDEGIIDEETIEQWGQRTHAHSMSP